LRRPIASKRVSQRLPASVMSITLGTTVIDSIGRRSSRSACAFVTPSEDERARFGPIRRLTRTPSTRHWPNHVSSPCRLARTKSDPVP
jgi:hypothetical protein